MPKVVDILLIAVTIVVLSVFSYFAADAFDAQQQVIERQNDMIQSQEELIDSHEEQVQAVRGAQECIVRLLLIHPDEREERDLTVNAILEACPRALDPENFGTEPSSVQPTWYNWNR